ncbi:MAG TPA: hypothetical protein VMV04_04870 [Thermodesulfobacteriota bacterium]|nr:hypothetical protein [Thermodesulfobacteriota bacterium]
MILIKDLVELSGKVGSTTKKKEKVSLLAGFLPRAKGEEIGLAVRYLSGQLLQGRLGIGWATLQEVFQDLSGHPRSPSLIEIDCSFKGISLEKGAGSSERRIRLLRDIFSSLQQDEREFLTGLILGEIRQGALEGLVLEAIAQASTLPVDRLRQSLMFSRDIGHVAQVALVPLGSGYLPDGRAAL